MCWGVDGISGRGKTGKADWGFVMRLVSSGDWSLGSCFMSLLISPHDVENSMRVDFLLTVQKPVEVFQGK